MGQFADLRGNIASIKKIIEDEIDTDYVKKKAISLIDSSVKIIDDIQKHDEYREEMDRHSGSAFDD